MILHYLKVAARSLMKYKMQSLISALCLAAGYASAIPISLWRR